MKNKSKNIGRWIELIEYLRNLECGILNGTINGKWESENGIHILEKNKKLIMW